MKLGDLVRVVNCDNEYEHDVYSGQVGVLVDIDTHNNIRQLLGAVNVYVVMLNGCEPAYFYEHEIELVSECDKNV